MLFSLPTPTKSSPANTAYTCNESDPQSYCNYFYQVGFQQGNFSDITVSIPSLKKIFSLHSLVLSRSPYLYQRLVNLPKYEPSVIELDYGPATIESFHLIFSHLYRPLSRQELAYLANEKPQIYLELIGVADYLELVALKDMLLHVILSQGFNESLAMRWIQLLQPFSSTKPWVKQLDERLLDYLIRDLPTILDVFPTSVKSNGGIMIGKHRVEGYMASKSFPRRGMTDLVEFYSTLPLVYLKRCLEHPDLPVQDSIQRYQFAKQVLQQRRNSVNYGKERVVLGLQSDSHHPSIHTSAFDKHLDSKNNNNTIMTVSLIQAPKPKLGKWNPSLYDFGSDCNDEEDL
ncbi:hypothetical protein BC941DRAFT_449835 [Chlamydoabsidia padenii]|nr:hypothetical protein BC941DRAFT_449835 [Chlamydoabsidia padenii]